MRWINKEASTAYIQFQREHIPPSHLNRVGQLHRSICNKVLGDLLFHFHFRYGGNNKHEVCITERAYNFHIDTQFQREHIKISPNLLQIVSQVDCGVGRDPCVYPGGGGGRSYFKTIYPDVWDGVSETYPLWRMEIKQLDRPKMVFEYSTKPRPYIFFF